MGAKIPDRWSRVNLLENNIEKRANNLQKYFKILREISKQPEVGGAALTTADLNKLP